MVDYTSIESLVRGSIDMHVHHGPDTFLPRRLDALEAARQAQAAGQRAIVLKSHKYPTAPLATIISQVVPGVAVFGSVCLDGEIGGLNACALRCSAELGAKVVWMPTGSSRNSVGKVAKMMGKPQEGPGLSLIDSKGKLVPEMDEILEIVKKHNMVLASGHISPPEVFALFKAAKAKGIDKMVVTHPTEAEIVDEPVSTEDQKRLAAMGAIIEHTVFGIMLGGFRHDPKELAGVIREVGPEHVIISTDLGQIQNPAPVEGMRLFIAVLLQEGFSPRDIEVMAKVNPARLLGLD